MSEELNSITPYRVVGNSDSYSFVSDAGVEYVAYFNRHNEILSCPVYEFAFECKATKRPPQDLRVRATIKAIIADFWTDNSNVIIFICDSLDRRSRSRKKLFDIWFSEASKGTAVIKTDFPIVGDFCASLLSYAGNSKLSEVIEELSELFKLIL